MLDQNVAFAGLAAAKEIRREDAVDCMDQPGEDKESPYRRRHCLRRPDGVHNPRNPRVFPGRRDLDLGLAVLTAGTITHWGRCAARRSVNGIARRHGTVPHGELAAHHQAAMALHKPRGRETHADCAVDHSTV